MTLLHTPLGRKGQGAIFIPGKGVLSSDLFIFILTLFLIFNFLTCIFILIFFKHILSNYFYTFNLIIFIHFLVLIIFIFI